MAIKLEDKKAIVAEVNEAAKAALSAVVADARGVTVGAMTGLRKEAREAGVYTAIGKLCALASALVAAA
ncbi:50S ribosomal protein L10, partial [Pseudomonas aeruginosa]|uniref:50S ribosomal protein L10 n=1 Tax=Pseudomonas aeruginosa TaxID=287 RepID=UPI0039684BEC